MLLKTNRFKYKFNYLSILLRTTYFFGMLASQKKKKKNCKFLSLLTKKLK